MINGKSVSLCMVVYNDSCEVKKLVEWLKGQQLIDEVVIVDQGSEESESVILESLADQYIKTTNKGNADFDRQFCYSLATKDYIIAFDADEFITEENCVILRKLMNDYEFECLWFKFNNNVTFEDKTVSIKDVLGEDPHPRFWKKLVGDDKRQVPTMIWPTGAHQFPQINTQKIVYSECCFEHNRQLVNIVKTHLRRGKAIDQNAQGQEKKFVKILLEKFGNDIKKKLETQIPELIEYLKN